MRIGMFDSGIGGLTVLKAFLKKYPNNEYIYYGDTLNVPYGDKSKEELLKLSTNIIKFLESKNVDIIIIACGTISSNVYEELKEICKVPLYNIIEEIPNYIEEKKYRHVVVIATNATINSHIFKQKIKISVTEIPCPKLVPLIENKDESIDNVIKEYINNIKADAIILGCTHYPIIKDKIRKIIGKNIDIIDMGEVLANRISLKDSVHRVELFFSEKTENLEENVREIIGEIC